MVLCCVPSCGTDSWKCDSSVTFYDFPTNPDLAAKWIKQINTAVKVRPMWFPRGKPVICSKHFLHTDFRGDTDSLKPRSIPTVFGHKYIGQNPEDNETNKLNDTKKSPLIVKVLKPQTSVIENNSDFRILDVRSEININDRKNVEGESSPEVFAVNEDNLQGSSHGNNLNIPHSLSNNSSESEAANEKANETSALEHKSRTVGANGIMNHISKGNSSKQANMLSKMNTKRKEKNNSDLIEIGPNTFLKINPDIIKVNRKQTPSGNTVLQFLMDQKLAKSYSSDLLPKLIQGVPPSSERENNRCDVTQVIESSNNSKNKVSDKQQKETVQHVLGHLVDTHVCEKSCTSLQEDDCVIMEDHCETSRNISDNEVPECQDKSGDMTEDCNKNKPSNADTSFIEKAPVLLTTNMPLSHCLIDKPKYILQLKQKSRQIASLKFKVSSLTKKIEELEDRCIVQERQLSYSFIKRLKTIRKNASKGDPSATYILEQIRSYSNTNNSKMRWSDSTLTQCAIWCRKAPYAYEYFKKADFFKLPCLGTVKRFMKKHPEIKFQKKNTKSGVQNGDDDESSSDFDFDESDDQKGTNDMSEDDNESAVCETVLSEMADSSITQDNVKDKNNKNESNEISKATESITDHESELNVKNTDSDNTNIEKTSKNNESNAIPITVDSSNLELQEIILPSGEVVQCYSSSIGNTTDIGSQYYIIPNVSDQNNAADHEYNVVQADSLPVILQNIGNSQLHLQQDQLIFIANSSDQVECSETEVTSA